MQHTISISEITKRVIESVPQELKDIMKDQSPSFYDFEDNNNGFPF